MGTRIQHGDKCENCIAIGHYCASCKLKTAEKKKILFNLKRHWIVDGKTVDLYEEIKAGRKTSEWRDGTDHWCKRLLKRRAKMYALETNTLTKKTQITLVIGTKPNLTAGITIFDAFLKARKAWFVVGYPKNSLPRIEADITGIIFHPIDNQFEIVIANPKEVRQ